MDRDLAEALEISRGKRIKVEKRHVVALANAYLDLSRRYGIMAGKTEKMAELMGTILDKASRRMLPPRKPFKPPEGNDGV